MNSIWTRESTPLLRLQSSSNGSVTAPCFEWLIRSLESTKKAFRLEKSAELLRWATTSAQSSPPGGFPGPPGHWPCPRPRSLAAALLTPGAAGGASAGARGVRGRGLGRAARGRGGRGCATGTEFLMMLSPNGS